MNKQTPLAEILRPKTIEDILGQNNITDNNSTIYNLIRSGKLFSMILWGPPGCGKTTLARVIAKDLNCKFVELSAVNSGIKDLRIATTNAEYDLKDSTINTVVFIDEIHRYSKIQQDALLPYIEKGIIYLIGATTENPSFQVIPALLSRVQIVILKNIDDENLLKIIRKGYSYLINNHGKANLDPKIGEFILRFANGDARTALNLVENSYFARDKENNINIELLENLVSRKTTRYGIDEHYDIASAFQKSIRGSDPDAAVYWLAKMITGGEDPRFIARRLIVTASEDIGNADPNALNIAVNAYRAVELIGFPEGRIPLAQAVIYLARAPKSNETIKSIDKALYDIESNGRNYPVPMHLRDAHYKGAANYGHGAEYKYSHNYPEVKQEFLPEELKGTKYID